MTVFMHHVKKIFFSNSDEVKVRGVALLGGRHLLKIYRRRCGAYSREVLIPGQR